MSTECPVKSWTRDPELMCFAMQKATRMIKLGTQAVEKISKIVDMIFIVTAGKLRPVLSTLNK